MTVEVKPRFMTEIFEEANYSGLNYLSLCGVFNPIFKRAKARELHSWRRLHSEANVSIRAREDLLRSPRGRDNYTTVVSISGPLSAFNHTTDLPFHLQAEEQPDLMLRWALFEFVEGEDPLLKDPGFVMCRGFNWPIYGAKDPKNT